MLLNDDSYNSPVGLDRNGIVLLLWENGTLCGSISPDELLSYVLGSGFEVITIGKKKLVRSVPTELNKDHNQILELAQGQGFVTVEQVRRRLSWTSGRVIDALETLLEEGLAMIDNGIKDGKCQYWFPCVSSVYSFVGSDT
ncbi:unnamed protein product [Brassica napus]|uniref:(rape) hypothetical protein n=1 Tax=Brassica napus TaxID=3708 RepID=A0A816R9C3_BRANA|nr:unnamed protein product [Brassica napus]